MNQRLFLSTIAILFLVSGINAQNGIQSIKSVSVVEENEKNILIDARPLLEKFSRANGIDMDKIEPVPPQLRKSAWNFSVGSPYSWWAHDLSGSSLTFYQTPTTCRAVGSNCYIFVEDSLWTNGRVDQTAVDKVKEAFDTKNALPNSTKGIYQTNTETFGNPPNVDNDPKIIILILNIRDGWTPGNSYTAGYFYSYNQGSASNSNKAEVFYLDARPLDLKSSGGINTGMSVTAHEFQHMIHYNYLSSATFINESFSEIASYVNGYSLRSTSRYAAEPHQYLFEWRDGNDGLIDYSRAARFSLYFREQFGDAFFKQYLTNRTRDINGINQALSSMFPPSSRRFADILEDWFIANYINNVAYNSKYGYINISQPKVTSTVFSNPNVNSTMDNVYKYGAKYISFKGGKNLSITLNNLGNNSLKAKAIKIGSGITEVSSVPMNNSEYSVPNFGTTFSDVTFVIYHNDDTQGTLTNDKGPHNFIYQSSGQFENQVIEIAHETTEPTGYLQLTPGDSVAVIFDAVQGMKLDSIKVALRGIIPIAGRILEYLGQSSRMGGNLMANFIATSTLLSPPGVPYSGQEYPYDKPYPNWVKVDLRPFNLNANKAFVVEFPIGQAYPASNRVLSTYYQSTSSWYSFSYQSTNNPPRWIYYTVSGRDGYIFLFLVRAYVSSIGSDVGEPLEILPAKYSLEQNYPNPFNPETAISFNLPKSSNVQIKIYDILGNEIRTLINEERIAGKHNIYWNSTDNSGKKVSSGVYFYTITSGDFSQTKKMILMK